MTETGDTTPISDEAIEAYRRAESTGRTAGLLARDYTRRGLAAALPLLVSAEAERLQAELDRIAKIPVIAYTLDLEAKIEGLRAELAEAKATIERKDYERRMFIEPRLATQRVRLAQFEADRLAALRAAGGQEKHGMVPGSHERPDGSECRCGAVWDRWNDRCVGRQSGGTR